MNVSLSESISDAIYFHGIYLSIITIFFEPFLIYSTFLKIKSCHSNLKIIFCFFLTAVCLMPISNFIIGWQITSKNDASIFLNILTPFCIQIIRTCDSAMSFERLIATKFFYYYSKSTKFYLLGPLFLTVAIIFAIFFGPIINACEFLIILNFHKKDFNFSES